ncbi:hypothetical protein ACXYTJ_17095 [Gilvimarinus sp. F26214L]|uniref:hypothetical protein n=1 Tax=Gilvimarinus sp. DZF01 TaxID=3461371 RepID=UPI004045E848
MSKDADNQRAARERAKQNADKLFGKRSKEQEKALKDVRTIGKPENLVKPENKDD